MLDIGEALAILDAGGRAGAYQLCIRSRTAHTYVLVVDTRGLRYHERVSVRRKRGESLASMILRLAEKARHTRSAVRPTRADRDSEIAASLGITL